MLPPRRYPSALHIEWHPPAGRMVKALAVDNEPTPFWDGADQGERLDGWRKADWKEEWGTWRSPGQLNGSSGVKVDSNVLEPLGLSREETWFTDCLDTYHLSDGAAARIADTYNPLSEDLDLPKVDLPTHPDTPEIIRRAQRDRLRKELEVVSPEVVISLGEAAFAVTAELLSVDEPARLPADASYGSSIPAELAGRVIRWIPLVHPGQAKEKWVAAHQAWMETFK